MGALNHIRLFGLFESYCERKFNQIAERLGLYSGDEVFAYLIKIAKLMLDKQSRSLSTDSIAVLSAQEFNERSIRSVDSKYIQILDEDILLEQKPSGAGMSLLVSFVYEEFMEYTMAASIWANIQGKNGVINHSEIANISKDLLIIKNKFISVLGIIFYLGSFLTKYKSEEGMMFIDWLINVKRENIACRMMAEWPVKQRSIFKKLITLHSTTTDSAVKNEVWRTITKIYTDYWDDFIKYLGKIKFNRNFRIGQIYSLFDETKGELSSQQRFQAVVWIAKEMQVLPDDFSRGLRTIQNIIFYSNKDWDYKQIEITDRILARVNLGEIIGG